MFKLVLGTLIVTFILIPCVNALPLIHFSSQVAIESNVYAYLRAAAYFLPMGTIRILFGISMAFWVFRVCVNIPRTVWEVLPFV